MKIVYMGTPEIAKVCLEKLYTEGFDIAAVYTKPDTPKNRGMKLIASEVKTYAQSVGLPVYQPETFRDDAVVEELKGLAPDLIIVVAYGKILPQRVLDIPRCGCINMHASILPELRGAGPVQWSILNHCDETGVTAMYLTAGMDEGDIIEIRKTPIEPMMAERFSFAAFSEPGRLMMRLVPLVPATARESMARGVTLRLSTHIATGIARISRSSTASVASGVTSRGERPVPPVVRIRFAWSSSAQ